MRLVLFHCTPRSYEGELAGGQAVGLSLSTSLCFEFLLAFLGFRFFRNCSPRVLLGIFLGYVTASHCTTVFLAHGYFSQCEHQR